MKILFALDDFPPVTYTSASMLTYNLAKELLKRGHEIFVITSVQDKLKQGEEECEGLKIFRIYSNYNSRWKYYLSLWNPSVVFKFRRIIKGINPDIVHFHHIHRYISYRCFNIAKKNAKAVFLTAHDVMLVNCGKLMPSKNGEYFYRVKTIEQIRNTKKRYNPLRNIIIRHYLKYIDKVFSVSNALKEFLKINGIKNIETIYNGINVEEWKTEKENIEKFKEKYNLYNKKTIFFGGRLSGAKGGDQILQAVSLIKKELSNDVVLLIAGERNKYVERMKKSIEKLNIDKNIIFMGWLDNEGLRTTYNSVDACVFPSICFETFGMSNLEAMACKKPVVSTNFGGPNEVVVDRETGYLVNPYQIKLMADKITDLLKNPQKAKQFGEAGYQRAKTKFSTRIHAEETLRWYLKFLTND
jgi:glycosyltransferase involved in cell wall biosynthesis